MAVIQQFLDDLRHAGRELSPLVAEQPGSTGHAQWDALLAGLVEHLAREQGAPVPAWTSEPRYVLETWWFVAGLPSLEATALVESPAALALRGVFVTAGALQRV